MDRNKHNQFTIESYKQRRGKLKQFKVSVFDILEKNKRREGKHEGGIYQTDKVELKVNQILFFKLKNRSDITDKI
jgi:uncharacterized protein (UPF0262 family)